MAWHLRNSRVNPGRHAEARCLSSPRIHFLKDTRMPFRNLTLKTRLMLLSIAGLASSIVMALVGYLALGAAGETERFLAEDSVPSLVLVSAINDASNNVRQTELSLVLAPNTTEVAADEKSLNN